MRRSCFKGLLGLTVPGLALFLAPPACQAGDVTIAKSTFDNSLDGWTSNTPAQITHADTGGNPGGYVRFVDASSASTYISAPNKFLGDYATLGLENTGVITFDHKIFDSTEVVKYGPYRVYLFGNNGVEATWTGPEPVVTDGKTPWVTVTAPLIQSDGWQVTGGTWSELMQDVTGLRIQMGIVDNRGGGTDVEGIDNVFLKTVPEPTGMTLAGVSLFGMSVSAWRRWRKRP